MEKLLLTLIPEGFIIKDHRKLGMGMFINDQPQSLASLIYDGGKFGIGTTGTRIFNTSEARDYSNHISKLINIVNSLNSRL